MDVTEIQDELLRLEYPNLLPDHDPDIERYYYLRSIGNSREALVIYQNRLIIRYPDNDFRMWLLRSYRSHDPAFRSLLAKGYRMLGARSLERVKRIILFIAERAESYNEKDVYSTIKAAEDILQFLSPERYEAMAGMERFLRYAGTLNLKVNSIARATELIRAYMTDTLSVVEEERRRRSETHRQMEEMERQRLVKADWDNYHFQKKYGVNASFVDLSAVIFSPEDIARIEIPYFNRVEDQILGYCIKYWNVSEDPAFERILFLYSRKYGKKNYDVYMTIRRGQQSKQRDDEILASIMSLLVTGYYYSIQGDLYVQRNWNVIKRTLANQEQQKALPAFAKGGTGQIKQIEAKPPAKQVKAKPKQPTVKQSKIIPKSRSTTTTTTTTKIVPQPVTFVRPVSVVARPATSVVRSAEKKPAPVKPVNVPNKLKPAQQTRTTIVATPPPKPAPPKPMSLRPAPPKPAPTKPMSLRPAPPKPAPPRPVPVRPAVSAQPIKPAYQPVAAKPTALRPVASAIAVPAAPKPPPIQPTVVRPAVLRPAAPAIAVPAVPKPPVRHAVAKSATFLSAAAKSRVVTNKTLGKAKGSVSDRLKELSGRSYDVYEDRFLAKARVSIRRVLGTGKGLFFTLPEEAEDLVYNFLRDHYSDPYMDWEDSVDRKNLLTMGFDLPSINPVIDACYRIL